MIHSWLDLDGRFRPALLAVFVAFWATFVAAPLQSHAANGESSSSTSAESGGSEEGRDTEDEDTDAADADADDREPASDGAAHLGNPAEVGNGAPITEPDLLVQRRKFSEALESWYNRPKKARDYETQRLATDAALYSDGRRTAVGEIDGVLAQHMTDLFAAESGLGTRVADAIGAFQQTYRQGSVKDFRAQLSSKEKSFRGELNALNKKYPGNWDKRPDGVKERDWLRDTERRVQLSHVIDETIPALKREIDLYRTLKDSTWGDNHVKAQKGTYVGSMQSALRQHAATLHDQQLFLMNGNVSLSELERVGGAMGEVHKLVVDWDSRNVFAPNEDFNGGFKPDDGVDLDMDLNATGIRTAPTMRMGARAVAYARVATLMGYGDMVPRTELAKIGGKYGVLQAWVEGEAPLTIVRRDLDYSDETDLLLRDQILKARRWVGKLVSDYYDASENIDLEGARGEMEAMRGTLDQYKPEFVQPEAQDPDAPRPPELIRILEAEHQSDAFREHDDADLRRQFAVAEILDRLTGQVDRHSYNFIISRDGRLMLIDNDQAFGHHADADERRGYGKQAEFPEYVDSDMAERIAALTANDLRMATIGLLTGPEQEALVQRLLSLQTKVKGARDSGNIIYVVPPQSGGDYKTWSNDGADLARQRRSYYGMVAGMPVAPPPPPT